MLDLGRFPYINNIDADNKVKDGKLTFEVEKDLDLTVKFYNDSDKAVQIEANKAEAVLYKDGVDHVLSSGKPLNTTALRVGAKEVVEFEKDVELAYSSTSGSEKLTAGEYKLVVTIPIKGTDTVIEDEVTIVITAKQADVDKVAAAKEALDVDYDGEAATVTLPTSLEGATISWKSSNVAVIEDGSASTTLGNVNRPSLADGDKTVKLTATITAGTATDTKEFTVTVKAEATADEAINLTKEALRINADLNAVTEDLELVTEGLHGADIEWTSSNNKVIGDGKPDSDGNTTVLGKVTRPTGADVRITLTATITKDSGTTATKVFEVVVKGQQ